MMPEHVKKLRRLQRRYERAEQVRIERDDAIRECIELGMTHAQIHRALDEHITRTRIGQIALEAANHP